MNSLVFAVAIALGSFLLFALEPMVAKSLLPSLGGAPMVWNTCVVFFQATLLAGYTFAHLVGGRTRRGAIALLVIAAGAAATLPIALQGAIPEGSPSFWLVSELTRSVGPVFFVLAAGTPALQTWFSKMTDHRARDPYFLYATSNAGSFAALLAYPILIEPELSLRTQQLAWAGLFLIYVPVLALCFWQIRHWPTSSHADIRMPPGETHLATGRDRWTWFVLAFIPSSLMLGVTTYVSTDVAAVPLIWVLPLALYLLTFVVAFGRDSERVTRSALRRMPLFLSASLFIMTGGVVPPIVFNIVLQLATFLLIALSAHGAIASSRPHVSRLTEFYLIVSAGGVAAGLFNVLVAPLMFTGPTEYPLMLVAAALIPLLAGRHETRDRWASDMTAAAAVGVAAGLGVVIFGRTGPTARVTVAIVGVLILIAFSQSRRPRRFALLLSALLVVSLVGPTAYGDVLHAERTFFGTYRVSQTENRRYRQLYHGTTLHGMQQPGVFPAEPLTYFHREGPFGQAYVSVPQISAAKRVAVVGLGVGSLAAYAHHEQHWTFFEIDPAVERVASDERYFSFMRECAQHCRVVIGDARLSLRAQDERYDVLVMDAFSSDAIPVHLLTVEAFGEYLARLGPNGTLVVHISNRYMDLAPLLAGLAAAHELHGVGRFQIVGGDALLTDGRTDSRWVVMSRDPKQLEPLLGQSGWKPLDSSRQVIWTDEYSNILSVLMR